MQKQHLLRPAQLYLVCSYLLLSATPFFSLMLGIPVENAATIIGLEIFFWLLLWSVFKRPNYFHWLLLPVFLALPIEIYLRLFFAQGISPHHLGIIFETSPKEAFEFLGRKTWLLALTSIGIFLWWYSLQIVSRKIFIWSHSSRWFCLAVLLFCTMGFVYGEEFGFNTPSHSVTSSPNSTSADEEEDSSPDDATWFQDYTAAYRATMPKLPAWADNDIDKELIGRTWPFGLAIHAADFLYERHYLSILAQKSSTFKFDASSDTTPKTIVIVIGESSRYDRWSLNGFKRDTNPHLKNETNLVSFTDIISAVSATRLSVPIIVSRKPATQSLKAGFSEKSFISAFKEAGYKTYWLSNQMTFGEFDTPISVFAKEADVTQFLNLGGFTNNSSFDQILLEPFQNALTDSAPKKLIVLHTLGNHWNYSHRHPAEFERWKPSLSGVQDPDYNNRDMKEQINNSYDNSILYTDWMLDQVITQLKAQQNISALLYVSDHGQTLYDGSCNLAFHGHNTQYEFHIPAFMWYSNDYLSAYPDKIEQLLRHKKARLSTENIFHSLLDIADVHYPTEQLDRSFVNAQFKPHVRYVDSYGWSNYDNARFKGDCREVIDKNKPLKQEK
ncbi:phosphoethanolamine transferase [Solimicrobium silvestre]|uniref:Putative membrane-associated metal-dependent hydrolase n=1 Tax=Solimicrobium silvestre TaxID=2099400 RepID=A0A2S9H2F6_9BURK|nr:phosphoethanolamine transferase [Solimicrobium silvestre]PRC94148.1 putative membrane-associated metal-dependent hydrolase [Solimicrobium silvestre]